MADQFRRTGRKSDRPPSAALADLRVWAGTTRAMINDAVTALTDAATKADCAPPQKREPFCRG